ncbi:P27 family phage terminase small subunit [Vibrio vulnificus]|uniref:P27 family phage terminase small subunit n=1 Tax=Vibrio vulnificus TaxID=672 RepID=UPI00324282DD
MTHVKMNEKETATFLSIKKMLEAERELQPSDLDAVALLALNLNIMDQAISCIDAEGAIIISHTQYGQVPKGNPAVALLHQTQQAVRALMDSLLMTPKAKAAINKSEVEKKEEDDPLTKILEKRSKRGA